MAKFGVRDVHAQERLDMRKLIGFIVMLARWFAQKIGF